MLFVSDVAGGLVPDIARDRHIWATSSCIVFGCLMFLDGETDVVLGSWDEVAINSYPSFDGTLDTPNRMVMVSTVGWEVVLKMAVPKAKTRVGIWTNHPSEPDNVIIGLG